MPFGYFPIKKPSLKYDVKTKMISSKLFHFHINNHNNVVDQGRRHKAQYYDERFHFFIRHFSNKSTLHRNNLAA